jgi:predicted GIY-YIG superfamily endonuclease
MKALFPHLNPLRLNLAEDFFRGLPTEAGVYIMRNQEREILYVGKAKNLKARLSSYCGSDLPRKVRRLIQQVRFIEWEVLPSEKEALLRENALLRLLRPPFNRQKTNPESYFFLRLDRQGVFLKVSLVREADAQGGSDCLGAFKGVSSLSSVLMALYRVLAVCLEKDSRIWSEGFPSSLQRDRARFPLSFQFVDESSAQQALSLSSRYLRGISKECIRMCETAMGGKDRPLIQWFLKRDLETLREFFEGQARRLFRMRKLTAGRKLIGRMELDDLIVHDAFDRKMHRSKGEATSSAATASQHEDLG